MTRGLVLVTGPDTEPVSTAEAKTHLRVDSADDDTYIDTLIAAARQACERSTRRAFLEQTWRLSLDAFPGADEDDLWEGTRVGPDLRKVARYVELPNPPLLGVTSVITYDDADAATTFAASNYYVDTDGSPGRVVLRTAANWPTALRVANAIQITYRAGYGNYGSDMPPQLVHAIKMLVGHWYAVRETVNAGNITSELPWTVAALLAPYRVMRL